jgi:hypothetical protein
MTVRRTRKLALAAAVGGLLGGAGREGRAVAPEAPDAPGRGACAAAVVVGGDEDAVAALAPRLGARGISTIVPDGCAAARARVERTDEGLVLRFEDPAGRRFERTVAGAEAAAALVESWVRSDLTAPLLAGRTAEGGDSGAGRGAAPGAGGEAAPGAGAGEDLPEPGATEAGAPVAATGAPGVALAGPPSAGPPRGSESPLGPPADLGVEGGLSARAGVPPAAGPRRAFAFGAAAEVARGPADAVWAGARLAGCVQVGPVCAGLVARLLAAGLDGRGKAKIGATDSEVLAGVDLPLRSGRLTMSPGAGVGLGWLSRRKRAPLFEAEPLSMASSLRAEARVTLGIRIVGGLVADVGVGAGAAPLLDAAEGGHNKTLGAREGWLLRGGIGLGYRGGGAHR